LRSAAKRLKPVIWHVEEKNCTSVPEENLARMHARIYRTRLTTLLEGSRRMCISIDSLIKIVLKVATQGSPPSKYITVLASSPGYCRRASNQVRTTTSSGCRM